jgi:hypothetical protein
MYKEILTILLIWLGTNLFVIAVERTNFKDAYRLAKYSGSRVTNFLLLVLASGAGLALGLSIAFAAREVTLIYYPMLEQDEIWLYLSLFLLFVFTCVSVTLSLRWQIDN